MKLSEAHRHFKIEADKLDIVSIASFLPEEIDHFLNTAIERIIKTRYSGLNVHKTGFQQNQKRSDDLRTVIKTSTDTNQFVLYSTLITYGLDTIVYHNGTFYKSNVAANNEDLSDDTFWTKLNSEQNRFEFEYPDDYWIGLGEKCSISKIVAPTSIGGPSSLSTIGVVDVIEATIENIDSKLNNSLSEYIFHNGKAKPIRLYSDNKIYIYTDSNYLVTSYSITYIAKPALVDFYDNEDDLDIAILPDHMWDEVIVNAVRYALENISENRYQTYSQESQLVE